MMDFAVTADYRVKIKESIKKDKYLDLARELKKLRNMKVPMIPTVMGVLFLVFYGCVYKTKTTALLRTARILRRVLET